jgi:predicted transcriptional regulator
MHIDPQKMHIEEGNLKFSRYTASVNTSVKILKTIMDYKEFAQYDLPGAVGKSYRSILRHLQLLEDYGMVKLVRLEPAKRGGKEKKIFGLTSMGLMQVWRFKYHHGGIKVEDMDKFADNYQELLPLILDKWKHFKNYRVMELIEYRLWASLGRLPDRISDMPQKTLAAQMKEIKASPMPKKGEEDRLSPAELRLLRKVAIDNLKNIPNLNKGKEEDDKDKLYFNVFFEKAGESEESPTEQLKLFSVLRKDKDLEAYTEKAFDRVEKACQIQWDNIQEWRQDWMETSKGRREDAAQKKT